MKKSKLLKIIDEKEKHYKSQHKKVVCLYAYEMVEYLEDINEFETKTLKQTLLNGAEDFLDYSMGGSSLISDYDISNRLPKTYGKLAQHKDGTYLLEAQAYYLYKAYKLIFKIIDERG